MRPFVAQHSAPKPSQPQKNFPEASRLERTAAPLAAKITDPVGGNYVDDNSVYVYGVRRVVYIALAGISFALGILGIPVPGLPTTPFLLLSSFFLARSWPRMHRTLLNNRVFGPALREWQEHRVVTPKIKLRASVLIAISIVLLISYSNLPLALLALVLTCAMVGQYVIYRLPTRQCPNEKPSEVFLKSSTRMTSMLSAGYPASH